MINTVSEGARFIRTLNHQNIRLLADSYHMRAEKESFDAIRKNIDIIYHAHIAEAKYGSNEVRRMPDQADEFKIKEFIDELVSANYQKGVSIEAGPRLGDWIKDANIAINAINSWK